MAIQSPSFQPYTVHVGFGEVQHTISSPYEQEALLQDLDEQINTSHQKQFVKSANAETQYMREIFKTLFEIKRFPLQNSCTLSPKIESMHIKKNVNILTTNYTNGVVFIQNFPIKQHLLPHSSVLLFHGKRRFPSKTEENGFFTSGEGQFLEGRCTKKDKITYAFMENSPYLISFANSSLALACITFKKNSKGWGNWKTVTILNQAQRTSPSYYCKLNPSDPYPLISAHLTEKAGLIFYRMCRHELLSPEQITPLIQELFKQRDSGLDLLIFDYGFIATQHVLQKIQELKIAVDLQVLSPSKEMTFVDHWVSMLFQLSQNKKIPPEKSQEVFHIECARLFAINPHLRLESTQWKNLMAYFIQSKPPLKKPTNPTKP